MSNPSRHDYQHRKLLSGFAGEFLLKECLDRSSGFNEHNIHVLDLESWEQSMGRNFPSNTKGVLVLGEKAKDAVLPELADNTLGQQRGCQHKKGGIYYLCSYLPQDAFDRRDYEGSLNPLLGGEVDEANDDKDTSDVVEKSRHGRTSRKNWKFWLQNDCAKLQRILARPTITESPDIPIEIYPNLDTLLRILHAYENAPLYVDIETDEHFNLTCIGLGFRGSINTIFVVPIWLYDGSTGYDGAGMLSLAKGLVKAFSCNEIITHNGSAFDLLILAQRYHIPVPRRNFDTMLAFHRMYPEVDKSLGHVMSLLTYEPYHKDEGILSPKNFVQQSQLWEYNAKDIRGTMLVHEKMLELMERDKGLESSIKLANKCIYTYLMMTFTGICFKEDKRQEKLSANDRELTQINRVIKLLLGEDILAIVSSNKSGKASPLPGSPQQCVKYFHEIMKYKVVAKTVKGGPSLGGVAILKLKLKEECKHNPVLDLVLRYRELSKESGTLGFRTMEEVEI